MRRRWFHQSQALQGPCGIRPRAATGTDALDNRINELWEAWAARSDADGLADFHGLTTLAVREMIEGGDVFLRRRIRRAEDKLPVPLQLQLLEADHLDDTKIGALPDGGRIMRGIEYDTIGRRRAYWLFAVWRRSRHRGASSARPAEPE